MSELTPPTDTPLADERMRQLEQHARVFASLGARLGQATTVRRAVETAMEVADELWGWDSCNMHLYSTELDRCICLLAKDIINGCRAEVSRRSYELEFRETPTPRMREVLKGGPLLILRKTPVNLNASEFFGDVQRPSASIIYLAIHQGGEITGFLSIQSYSVNAYDSDDLAGFQALSDHLGEAIHRIQIDEHYRDLFECAIEGVCQIIPAGRFLKANSALGRILGYDSARELKSSVTDISRQIFVTPERWQELQQTLERQGEVRDFAAELRCKDGRTRWVLMNFRMVFDERGTLSCYAGTLLDISERKRAELLSQTLSKLGQALLATTSLREIASAVSEATQKVFAWDAFAFSMCFVESGAASPVLLMDTINGLKTEVKSARAEGGLKISTAERRTIEKGAELILRPGPVPRMDPDAVAYGDTSRASAAVMRVPLKLWANINAVVALHSYTFNAYSKDDLAAFQTVVDYCGGAIERIQADKALRQSESQFRLIWETSADGMRLCDPEGAILRVNEAFCRMVQMSRTELEGKPMSVVYARNQEEILKAYQRNIQTGHVESNKETHLTLWNGVAVWFDVSNSQFELPGKPVLLLSIFRDITQRKHTEAEIGRMHRQLLESSHKAGMAEVATGVLHNVGNVLNSVNVSCALTKDRVRSSKTANLGKIVSLMREHAADLAAFLTQDPKGRQLCDYMASLADHLAANQKEVLRELDNLSSNIDHIKQIVSMQQSYATVAGFKDKVPPVQLIEDALRINSGSEVWHDVRIIRRFEEVPPILVDKHKVLQILINLISNAKYALIEKGHEDKEMILEITNGEKNSVVIEVADNGIGIPEENLKRMFQQGFTTRKTGHGFGLHNAALAARELGGTLVVRSDGPGCGAAFILELPCGSEVVTSEIETASSH